MFSSLLTSGLLISCLDINDQSNIDQTVGIIAISSFSIWLPTFVYGIANYVRWKLTDSDGNGCIILLNIISAPLNALSLPMWILCGVIYILQQTLNHDSESYTSIVIVLSISAFIFLLIPLAYIVKKTSCCSFKRYNDKVYESNIRKNVN